MYAPIGPWLDTAAAAKYLGCGKVMLEAMRAKGTGPAFPKVGRFVRYSVKALDSWMQENSPQRRADDQQVAP